MQAGMQEGENTKVSPEPKTMCPTGQKRKTRRETNEFPTISEA